VRQGLPRWLEPRTLSSQIAIIVAVGLFVAQTINFALLLEGHRRLRYEQTVGPIVVRLTDAISRIERGRILPDDRFPGRVRLVALNPLPSDGGRLPDIEAGLRQGLADNGIRVGTIVTDLRRISPDDPRLARFNPRQRAHWARMGGALRVAVELPGRGWLVLGGPWLRTDLPVIGQLIIQTIVLYIVVLVPLLWATRRISRPLRALAEATQQFQPGRQGIPVEEGGPADVRAVIAAFNALRLRVTAMIDEKDRMLGAIGHDLRTPLAALRVRIESVEDESDRTKMAETIDEMNRTLDDILSLARLGRPSEPATDSDLAALVDAVVEDFRDIGADVRFVESDRLTLRLRPSLMRRAVRNLIENAVKYGGGAEVRIEERTSGVAIVVADRGPGIPPDRIDSVFDPFTRLETSRNRATGGIGLGLALARAIAREAGGDITLANRTGGGLDAVLTLPRGG